MGKYSGIMVDIETLGIGPGHIVGTIGAVAFNPQGGELGPTLSLRLDMEEQERLGLKISASTFIWWLGQSSEARAEMREPGRMLLGEALHELSTFLAEYADYGATMWAKSPRFDLAMIETLYEMAGMERPWHFSAEDDVRTTVRMADIEPPTVKGAHTALGDARAQAILVQDCYQRLSIGIGHVEPLDA